MTSCSDGGAYQVLCSGGTCQCLVDASPTKTYADNACGDLAGRNATCGWNLLTTW